MVMAIYDQVNNPLRAPYGRACSYPLGSELTSGLLDLGRREPLESRSIMRVRGADLISKLYIMVMMIMVIFDHHPRTFKSLRACSKMP